MDKIRYTSEELPVKVDDEVFVELSLVERLMGLFSFSIYPREYRGCVTYVFDPDNSSTTNGNNDYGIGIRVDQNKELFRLSTDRIHFMSRRTGRQYFGKLKPPAYVNFIRNGNINFSHLSRSKKTDLTSKGIKFESFPDNNIIKFDEEGDAHLSTNRNLAKVVTTLILEDIVFAQDYKQGWGPSDILEALQASGVLKLSFRSIFWKRPGAWYLRLHKVKPNKRMQRTNLSASR